MANRTFLPAAFRFFAMSAIANCACATANPYPGVIIILFASIMASVTESTVTVVTSPSISTASPLGAIVVPAPPRMTLTISLPIASHMIQVKIAPENPMRAPTWARSGLLRRKPSAHNAHPEYEFKTVMTTGISAPPMLAVRCQPRTELTAAAIPRLPSRKVSGSTEARPEAMSGLKKAAIPRVHAPSMARLSWSLPGSCNGAESIIPDNFPNATKDPEKVTPPIKVAR
mmetsp:Transcript_15380/g.38760  ORF Transcript_15380/g.38760 Transcript_15380/m.38760 type:complete len:229 (+) Transcript_15380:444-1130(+)